MPFFSSKFRLKHISLFGTRKLDQVRDDSISLLMPFYFLELCADVTTFTKGRTVEDDINVLVKYKSDRVVNGTFVISQVRTVKTIMCYLSIN